MTMRTFAISLLFALLAAGAGAHDTARRAAVDPDRTASNAPTGGTRDARTYFTDVELVTQDARNVRFYSDTLANRTVVINVIYTHCKDACPLITQTLKEVRDRLGDRFGKDVHFITLTSDPARDSPAEMRKFAREQGVDVPGWLFLTGGRDNTAFVLKRLGMYSENFEEHSTLLIAGNVAAKRWTKIRPDTHPQLIAERLRLLAGATPDAANAH